MSGSLNSTAGLKLASTGLFTSCGGAECRGQSNRRRNLVRCQRRHCCKSNCSLSSLRIYTQFCVSSCFCLYRISERGKSGRCRQRNFCLETRLAFSTGFLLTLRPLERHTNELLTTVSVESWMKIMKSAWTFLYGISPLTICICVPQCLIPRLLPANANCSISTKAPISRCCSNCETHG